jgi:hypothetical protein
MLLGRYRHFPTAEEKLARARTVVCGMVVATSRTHILLSTQDQWLQWAERPEQRPYQPPIGNHVCLTLDARDRIQRVQDRTPEKGGGDIPFRV